MADGTATERKLTRTLEGVLACPRCHGEISMGESILCETCGRVGTTTLGFADFLADRHSLPIAAGGSFDLTTDREMAIELADSADRLSYRRLRAKAEEQRPPGIIRDSGRPSSLIADRARRRFERKYADVEREVSVHAGESDLSKAGAYLQHVGGPSLTGGLAVEAGGGHGLHLPAFAKRFDQVVMVDCSLNLMVLARKLCAELGLANVSFVRGNVESLPLRSGSARFVHSSGVIEHAADPAAMVADADRILASPGVYVCVSPNRFPITPEPHFAIPLFGAFPRSLRRRVLLPLLRGVDDEAGTDLLSLADLRRELAASGDRREIFFLPPQLERTVRNTGSRRALVRIMSSPVGRPVALFVANRLLLPIAPYQMGVAIKDA